MYSHVTSYNLVTIINWNCFFHLDLTKHLVNDYAGIEKLMDMGNSHRFVKFLQLWFEYNYIVYTVL